MKTRAGPKTFCELRREGSEHILLSNKGRNICAYVYLFAFLLCREPFIQLTSRLAGVLLRTQGCALSHFGAIWKRDMFRINKLLINYTTAQAGSSAPHAGRVLNAQRTDTALVIQNTHVC